MKIRGALKQGQKPCGRCNTLSNTLGIVTKACRLDGCWLVLTTNSSHCSSWRRTTIRTLIPWASAAWVQATAAHYRVLVIHGNMTWWTCFASMLSSFLIVFRWLPEIGNLVIDMIRSVPCSCGILFSVVYHSVNFRSRFVFRGVFSEDRVTYSSHGKTNLSTWDAECEFNCTYC